MELFEDLDNEDDRLKVTLDGRDFTTGIHHAAKTCKNSMYETSCKPYEYVGTSKLSYD